MTTDTPSSFNTQPPQTPNPPSLLRILTHYPILTSLLTFLHQSDAIELICTSRGTYFTIIGTLCPRACLPIPGTPPIPVTSPTAGTPEATITTPSPSPLTKALKRHTCGGSEHHCVPRRRCWTCREWIGVGCGVIKEAGMMLFASVHAPVAEGGEGVGGDGAGGAGGGGNGGGSGGGGGLRFNRFRSSWKFNGIIGGRCFGHCGYTLVRPTSTSTSTSGIKPEDMLHHGIYQCNCPLAPTHDQNPRQFNWLWKRRICITCDALPVESLIRINRARVHLRSLRRGDTGMGVRDMGAYGSGERNRSTIRADTGGNQTNTGGGTTEGMGLGIGVIDVVSGVVREGGPSSSGADTVVLSRLHKRMAEWRRWGRQLLGRQMDARRARDSLRAKGGEGEAEGA